MDSLNLQDGRQLISLSYINISESKHATKNLEMYFRAISIALSDRPVKKYIAHPYKLTCSSFKHEFSLFPENSHSITNLYHFIPMLYEIESTTSPEKIFKL